MPSRRKDESVEQYKARVRDYWRERRATPEGRGIAAAKALAWYYANKERHRASVKRYRASNPHIKRAEKSARRAAIRGAGGRFTKADIKNLYASQKGLCVYCRSRLGGKYEIDHIEPLARGGSNDRRNIQLLCVSCNRRKGAKDPIAFAQEGGLLI